MEWIPAAVPVLAVCLPCLHTRGLQPAAQGVDADTKFIGNLCARTALFCHHPDRSALERLVVPGRRYPFFAFVFHFLCPFSIITNAFLSINSGKGAKLSKQAVERIVADLTPEERRLAAILGQDYFCLLYTSDAADD